MYLPFPSLNPHVSLVTSNYNFVAIELQYIDILF